MLLRSKISQVLKSKNQKALKEKEGLIRQPKPT